MPDGEKPSFRDLLYICLILLKLQCALPALKDLTEHDPCTISFDLLKLGFFTPESRVHYSRALDTKLQSCIYFARLRALKSFNRQCALTYGRDLFFFSIRELCYAVVNKWSLT